MIDFELAFFETYKRQPTVLEKHNPVKLSAVRMCVPTVQLDEMQKQESEALVRFPRIYDANGHLYYGGDQQWYPRKTQQMGGCGPVAAVNTLAAYSVGKHAVLKAFNLPPMVDGKIKKDDYITLMQDVYKAMGTMELPIANIAADALHKKGKTVPAWLTASFGQQAAGFVYGTLKYALQRGIYLSYRAFPLAYANKEEALRFIKQSLATGCPVTMLTGWNRHPLRMYKNGPERPPVALEKGVASHFVNIVGVQAFGDSIHILVSTWGQLGIIPYNALYKSWQSPKAAGACLFAFWGSKSKELTKKQMHTAYVLLPKLVLSTVKKTAQNILA
ncbi:MAG: hypothetical protein ACK5JF_10915 [Oscillospiraceae bacterium]